MHVCYGSCILSAKIKGLKCACLKNKEKKKEEGKFNEKEQHYLSMMLLKGIFLSLPRVTTKQYIIK
jgi:hypothetical protein